jgi:hypothetical protein
MDRPVIKSTDLVTVCGQRGTGKTQWIKAIISKFKSVDVLIFDPMGEYRTPPFEVYIPETQSPEELAEVCAYVFRKGNHLLVVSEAELYMPNVSYLPSDTFRLLTQGRHRNTAVWADTRRIANLSKTMFSLSEHCIVFRHFGNNDLKYLSEWIPNRESVRGLLDYHFIYYHRGSSTVYPPITLSSDKRRD